MLNPERFTILILLFVALAFQGYSQQSPTITNRSTTIQRIDGKEYFFHAVLQGQTLFSIARAYGVTVDDIIRENPELRNSELRFDQIIRIPVAQQPSGVAQGIQSTTVKEVTFVEHQVKRRETVYGIARMYNITESQLLEHNPQARSGLRVNMMLRIPRVRDVFVYYKEYQVPQGQTLFSITREFGVTIAQLERLNPELRDGLKAGQILRLPVEQPETTPPPFIPDPDEQQFQSPAESKPLVSDPYCLNPQRKTQYNIALLIPLYLETIDPENPFPPSQHNKAYDFIEYYEGIMIALDSIRQMGADIRLTVYDVCNQDIKARRAIWSPEMATMDLIIGPFYPEVIPTVVSFAANRNIPMVLPYNSDDRAFNRDLLRRNSNIFQATPDIATQLNDMARFVVENHPEDNIIVVHNSQAGIMDLISGYKQTLNNGLNRHRFQRDSMNLARISGYHLNGVYIGERISNVYVLHDSLRQQQKETGNINKPDFRQYAGQDNVSEIVFSRDGITGLRSRLDSSRRNVVISLMGNEALIANYTRQLNQLRDTFQITVFGVPQWRDYPSVDFNYLQNLRTHIFSTDFIDYNSRHNIDFIRRYRNMNHIEPQFMAFRAMETGMFFFRALHEFGPQFYRCMDLISHRDDFDGPFHFQRTIENGGWENNFVHIFRYENFNLRNVRNPARQTSAIGR